MNRTTPPASNRFTTNLLTTQMMIVRHAALLIGFWLMAKEPPKRDERGLSQSAETAILIGGAVAIAIIVIGFITKFVQAKLAEI